VNTASAGPPATESPAARRSAPISREAVFEAAWALTKAGSRPTIERIRLYLGNGTPRGSPNTVNTFLTQWWEQLAVRVAGGPMEAIHGLPPSVSATLETLWNQALLAAKETWHKDLADREQAIVERAAALEHQTRELTAREQNLAGRASSLETALELAREQLAAANQRAETLEATEVRRTGEIQALQEHCRSSDAEIRGLQKQLETERAELARQATADRNALIARFDAREAQWLRDIDEARQVAKERGQEVKRIRAELAATIKQRDRLERDLSKAKTRSSIARTPRHAKVSAKRTRR
jgi:hypothetical protein